MISHAINLRLLLHHSSIETGKVLYSQIDLSLMDVFRLDLLFGFYPIRSLYCKRDE
jgi:hypothetical protein